jgi:hypothetical protein
VNEACALRRATDEQGAKVVQSHEKYEAVGAQACC